MDSQIHNPTQDNAAGMPDTTSAPPTNPFGMLKRPSALAGASAWNEEATPKNKGMHPATRIALYVLLGLCSFLLFLYLTFPYGVIKEVAVSKINEQFQSQGLPLRLSIGSMSPSWLTGVKLKNVQLTNAADAKANLKLDEVTARFNAIPLLWGTIRVTAALEQGSGSLDTAIELPLIDTIRGYAAPKYARVTLNRFALDPLFNHGLAVVRGSKDPAMVLILPLVAKTSAGGAVSGKVLFQNPDVTNFVRAKGTFDLNISKAFLHIDDSTLKIPRQEFEAAKIDMKFENNALVFGDQTQLKAQNIGVGLNGRVALPETPEAVANADLNMALSMSGEIEKNLGFIVPNMLRCKPLEGGELKAKLTGPVTTMKCE